MSLLVYFQHGPRCLSESIRTLWYDHSQTKENKNNSEMVPSRKTPRSPPSLAYRRWVYYYYYSEIYLQIAVYVLTLLCFVTLTLVFVLLIRNLTSNLIVDLMDTLDEGRDNLEVVNQTTVPPPTHTTSDNSSWYFDFIGGIN